MKSLRHQVARLCVLLSLFFFSFSAFAVHAAESDTLLLQNTDGTARNGGFSYVVLLEDHTIVAELPVKLSRQSDTVSIVPARDLVSYLSTSVNVERDVTFVYTWDTKELRAPVKLSQKVGEVEAYLGETLLDKADLVTNYTVSKSLLSELSEYAKYIFLHPVTLLLIGALIAFSVIRLLRGARMASAIKAGFLATDPDQESEEKEEKEEPQNSQETQ